MLVTVTHSTNTTHTKSSSSLGSPTLVGSLRALTQPLRLLRLLQLLSTCIAFSLVASVNTWAGFMGNWCMFTWCFCFAMTLLILLVDLTGLETPWHNVSITCAYYAALSCLSSSIIYPTTYAQFLPHSRARNHAIAATAFSCIAFVAYAMWPGLRPDPGESGLLKVLETFVACVIFAFISEPSLFHQLILHWCLFVFTICFTYSAVDMLHDLSVRTIPLHLQFPSILSARSSLLSVLLYATSLVIWPLYQFDEKYGGTPRRSDDPYCSNSHSAALCNWDRCLVVTILTAINFLAYLGDLVYSYRLAFDQFRITKRHPSTSSSQPRLPKPHDLAL